MKSLRTTLISFIILFFLVAIPGYSAINPDSTIVQLRKDCGQLDDCFGTMEDLLDWTWGATGNPNPRNPTAQSPLTVLIGPGEYAPFKCTGGQNGYVSLKGSGRDVTKIVSRNLAFMAVPVRVNGCTELAFSDLSVILSSTTEYSIGYAIWWSNGGSSVWNNVYVESSNLTEGVYNTAWYDNGVGDSVHYWYNSKLRVIGDGVGRFHGYESQVAESWFYGSEIEVIAKSNASGDSFVGVNTSNGQADVRLFGSVVRVHADTSGGAVNGTLSFTGINGGTTKVVHMHGGNVSVDASAATGVVNATGIKGAAHTLETAVGVKAGQGGGFATRISGAAQSPTQWPPGTQPPAVTSTTGSDLFIETDCDFNGDCSGAGSDPHPHIMVYDASCNGGTDPWFDSTRGKCRGAP